MKKNYIYNKFNNDPFHTHMKVLALVESGSKVLEVGAATGYFSQELLKKNCRVLAIEKDEKMAAIARKRGITTAVGDIFEIIDRLMRKKEKFDVVVYADILEHLKDPDIVLEKTKNILKKEGYLVVSLPNIANFSIRLDLLLGKFEYQEYGIMDKTHVRFFTLRTARDLFKKSGYRVVKFDVVSGFECFKFYAKTLGRITFRIPIFRQLENFITQRFPGFFALEFIFKLKQK